MAKFWSERTWRRRATWFLACAAFVGPARAAGRIAGLVRTEDGIAFPAAVVTSTRIPRYTKGDRPGSLRLAPGEIQVSSKVSSRADGTFEIANLPAGQYLLCVETPVAAFLNPCKWTGGTLVNVPEDGAVTGKEIRVRKAATLRVRIDDPASLVPATATLAQLTVGVVTGSGAFHAPSLASRDNTGRTLFLLVPPDTPLKLRAYAASVFLADDTGASVDRPGFDIPFQAPAALQTKDITLKVVGPKLPVPVPPVAPRPRVSPPTPFPFPKTPRQGGRIFRQPAPPTLSPPAPTSPQPVLPPTPSPLGSP